MGGSDMVRGGDARRWLLCTHASLTTFGCTPLPLQIGGNAYSNQTGNFYGNYPSRELYSRWAMVRVSLATLGACLLRGWRR